MAKYQGYAQRKAYQRSKANLQQPRFQSRFDQDEFAAQQAPREGLTRLQEFHSSVVKSADQHRKDLYNVATDYLKQKKQTQINEARVVEQNQQLDRNLLTTYENSLTQNQNIQAANARLALAEEQQRSKDLQGLIKGVTSTIGVLHDKRLEAIRKQVTIDYNTPGSEASETNDKNLGIIRNSIRLNNEASTNLAFTAMEEGANPIVVANIRKPNNYREFVHLELWLKSLGEKAPSEIQSQVNLLEESERTSENLQKIVQDYLEKNGLVSKDGEQPFVLGNELMSHVLLPINKTVRSLEQTFQNEEIDRINEGEFETFTNLWSKDPTNPENNLNGLYKESRLLTENGKFLTPQQSLQRVGDFLSTINPEHYPLYENQTREIGGKWSTSKVGTESLFKYAKEKWNNRIAKIRKELEKENKNIDFKFSQQAKKEELDIPENDKLEFWLEKAQNAKDLQKNDSGTTYEESIKLAHSKINYLTESNLGQQDLSKIIPHMRLLSKMGRNEDLVFYIDNNPTLNIQQQQFLRKQYIAFTGELIDSGVTEKNVREKLTPVLLSALKIKSKANSLTFEDTLDIAIGKYYDYYEEDRKQLDDLSGPIPFDLIRNISQGAIEKVMTEIANGEQNPESEFHVTFDGSRKGRNFKNQIPNKENTARAEQEIQKRIQQQKQSADIQSAVVGFKPIFSEEEVTELLERVEQAKNKNEPIDWEEVLPNYIYKSLKAADLSIPTFINQEAILTGLTSPENSSLVPLSASDYLLADGDFNIEPNYFHYVNDAKTNAILSNLDIWKRYRKEFLNKRIEELQGKIMGGVK